MQALLIILISFCIAFLLPDHIKTKDSINITINIGMLSPEKKESVLQQVEQSIKDLNNTRENYCIKIKGFYQVRNGKEDFEISVKGTLTELKKEGTRNLEALLSTIQ